MDLNKSTKMKKKSKICFAICGKIFMLYCFLFISVSNVNAQKGLFAKFSIGPGFTTEYSNINSNGFSVVTKNHAIGWGITDKFAIQIGEFGGLNKQKFGDYKYINLDAFGLGFSYHTPVDIKISVLATYSMVSLAKEMVAIFWR